MSSRSTIRLARRPLLLEPPAMAAPDIAFILIVFFLVCASVQPDTGRRQTIPRTEEEQEPSRQTRTVEVSITPGAVVLNGSIVPADRLETAIADLLRGTTAEDERIVVVKSSPDTMYDDWIAATGAIERAGGIITLQLEEERTITVD